jgi:hypothetical protein
MNRCVRMLVLIALLFPLLAQAAPRAWLDRDSIRMGETVTLNVETDARGGSEPDFSVLDANFRRLGTSSNTQLSWVNGKQSARTLWAVALEPRTEGVIGIPALAVGNSTTEPLTLRVLPLPTGGSAAAGDDVFLEVEAEPSDPYVQQQVRYTVRLYYAVTLLEGQLEEPQAPGAQIRRLGQDAQYQKMLGERRYNVVERRYAIVPETSGALEIPGPQFRGRTLRTSGYGSLLSPSATLAARADALALEVRPRPAAAATPWLPAQALGLTDESGELPTQLQVGEPLTLTLRLSAQGLAAEQLPELALPAIDGAEIYPDQESSQTRDDGQWLRGERVRKFAIVPTRAGTIALPAITIDWWDVANDRMQRAELPARSLRVADASGQVPAPPAMTPDDVREAEGAASPSADAGPTSVLQAPWFWPALAATFALLWLGTLFARRRRPAPADAAPARVNAAPHRDDWPRSWHGALARADLAAAAQALIFVAQARDPAARHLGDVIAQLADETQRAAVARLEQALYRPGTDAPWLATELRDAFEKGPRWRGTAVSPANGDALPPLYPEHRPPR